MQLYLLLHNHNSGLTFNNDLPILVFNGCF